MICWSCEKAVEPGVVCPHCKAVLPPEGAADHFAVLGVARRFTIDHAALESRYRELARRVHPDRFARADPRERRAAMQRTVQINEAWRVLREPFQRAEYLLSLYGVGIGDDSGRRASSQQGVQREVSMPAAFLGEMLEKREELGEAQLANDRETVDALVKEMSRRSKDAMQGVASRLDGASAGDTTATQDNADTGDVVLRTEEAEDIARELATVRYFRRFLEQAEAVAEKMRQQGEAAASAAEHAHGG